MSDPYRPELLSTGHLCLGWWVDRGPSAMAHAVSIVQNCRLLLGSSRLRLHLRFTTNTEHNNVCAQLVCQPVSVLTSLSSRLDFANRKASYSRQRLACSVLPRPGLPGPFRGPWHPSPAQLTLQCNHHPGPLPPKASPQRSVTGRRPGVCPPPWSALRDWMSLKPDVMQQ